MLKGQGSSLDAVILIRAGDLTIFVLLKITIRFLSRESKGTGIENKETRWSLTARSRYWRWVRVLPTEHTSSSVFGSRARNSAAKVQLLESTLTLKFPSNSEDGKLEQNKVKV